MSEILRQAHSMIDVDVKTTLTDSFLERIDLNDDIEGIDGSRISTIQSEK